MSTSIRSRACNMHVHLNLGRSGCISSMDAWVKVQRSGTDVSASSQTFRTGPPPDSWPGRSPHLCCLLPSTALHIFHNTPRYGDPGDQQRLNTSGAEGPGGQRSSSDPRRGTIDWCIPEWLSSAAGDAAAHSTRRLVAPPRLWYFPPHGRHEHVPRPASIRGAPEDERRDAPEEKAAVQW